MAKPSSSSQSRGRKGGVELSRQLIALLASFEHENDTITLSGVMERLNIDERQAQRLMDMLLDIAATENYYVSLYPSDDLTGISLAFDQGMHGRALRLTREETISLLAALEQIGIPKNDPTRSKIQTMLGSVDTANTTMEHLVSPSGTPDIAHVITTCMQAIIDKHILSMDYCGAGDTTATHRHVIPRQLQQDSGFWYLDCWDLDRADSRLFRLDRMTNVCDEGDVPARALKQNSLSQPSDSDQTPYSVTLTFENDEPLKLFNWHELERKELADGRIRIRTPYLGGDWLVRHIAACASQVTCDNKFIMERAKKYAQSLQLTASEYYDANSQ